jgi:hypothetical protein
MRKKLKKAPALRASLSDGYRAMVTETEAEREAHDWIEGLIGKTLSEEDFSDWTGYPFAS